MNIKNFGLKNFKSKKNLVQKHSWSKKYLIQKNLSMKNVGTFGIRIISFQNNYQKNILIKRNLVPKDYESKIKVIATPTSDHILSNTLTVILLADS